MKAMAKMAWGAVPNKRQVLMIVLIVCVVLGGVGAIAVGVDVPFKEKTVAEIIIDNHYENWRVHANATKTFAAKDRKDELIRECDLYKAEIKAIRLARWQLMAIQNMEPFQKTIEIEMADSDLEDARKKLQVAERGLTDALHTYDNLVAQR